MKIGKHEPNKIGETLEEFKKLRFNKEFLITHVVSGSTFRAYRDHKQRTPQSLFRNWAFTHLFELKEEIEKMAARQVGPDPRLDVNIADFENLHSKTKNNLIEFWKKVDGEDLHEHQALKLVDLLFKGLVSWADLSEHTREWLLRNAHVPVDKFSLGKLREVSPEFAKTNQLKSGASMGWLKNNDKMYQKIQNEIRTICEGYPPLVFDLLAWDGARNFDLKSKIKKSKS